MQTNTAYMSEPARAERVVREALNLPLSRLDNYWNHKNINFIAEQIFAKEKLEPEKAWNMSLIDFICLIKGMGDNPLYDWPDHSSLVERQFCYLCLSYALLNCSPNLIPMRMFLSLPLKAFFDCIKRLEDTEIKRLCWNDSGNSLDVTKYRIRKKQSYLNWRQYDAKMTGLYTGKPDYTVKQYLNDQINITKKSWAIFMPLEKYEQECSAAHDAMGDLLVNSFCRAFPSCFKEEQVKAKYRDNAYDKNGGQTSPELP